MKTVFIVLFLVAFSFTASSQDNQESAEQRTAKESISNTFTYRLYPTKNMWTFIKLNTRNGQMWQVQYDTPGDNRHEVSLNLIPLVALEDEANDRFTLYSTQNIYTFILLDQQDGKTWQIQWSTERKNRLIIPIE